MALATSTELLPVGVAPHARVAAEWSSKLPLRSPVFSVVITLLDIRWARADTERAKLRRAIPSGPRPSRPFPNQRIALRTLTAHTTLTRFHPRQKLADSHLLRVLAPLP